MRLGRAVRLSARSLVARGRRATLAAASVALGVAAVIVTSALGQGVRDEVMQDVAAMGTHLLVVRPAQVERHVAHPTIRGRVTTLRPEDADAIGTLPRVRQAAAGRDGSVRVKVGRRSMNALAFGTTPSFFGLRGLQLRSGRFLRDHEDREAHRVAVLGARVADTLFPDGGAVGATVRLGGVPFEVVGVLRPRGVLADGSDEDGNVFIPARTALRRVFNATWLTSVFVSVIRAEEMDAAEASIREVLRRRHRLQPHAPDDFEIQNQARLLAMRASLADSLSVLAAGLAGASLLVGGTGVLALMWLSVRERSGEIGLRRAVGARPRDVFAQLLIEASLLSAGGWVAGTVVGGGIVVLVATLTEWRVGIPAGGVAATIATTAVTGVLFGSVPARSAARVPPIRALRARA